MKIERGGTAREGNVYRYGKFLNLEIKKLLIKYRKIHNQCAANKEVVRFTYVIGKEIYFLEGELSEMLSYKNIVIITLNKNLDYTLFSKKHPRFEKVAVLKSQTEVIKKGGKSE